jgi:hypothetical protein
VRPGATHEISPPEEPTLTTVPTRGAGRLLNITIGDVQKYQSEAPNT